MEAIAKRTFLFLLPWDLHHAGGVNQVVLNLAYQFSHNGDRQSKVLISSWEYVRPRSGDYSFVQTIHYRLRPPWGRNRPVKHLLMFVLLLPAWSMRLYRLLATNNVDVVNAHYPTLAVLQFALLKWLGLFRGRLILSFHGMDIAAASQTRGVERLLWWLALRSAHRIVACSEALCKQITTFAPAFSDKVTAIHNGIDIDLLTRERDTRYTLDARLIKQRYVLSIGTFEHKKAHDVLIRAFCQVAPLDPELLLVLVGGTGETRDELRSLIASLSLNDRVLLFEDVPHHRIASFIEKATLFALASRVEPFGIVILEAGVFGVPVVATRVGGIVEIIEHGVTGRLVPPEDVDALAAEIVSLLQDPNERKRLGERLRRRVMEEFTWTKAHEKYVALIGE